MALEDDIKALTTALNANTAALKAGKPGAAAAATTTDTAKPGPGRPAGSTAAPKITADQVKAAIVNVKDTVSTDAAKEIISEAGAKDLANLLTMPKTFAKVMAACEAALVPPDADEGDAGDDGDGL